jgi:hypothetical protein
MNDRPNNLLQHDWQTPDAPESADDICDGCTIEEPDYRFPWLWRALDFITPWFVLFAYCVIFAYVAVAIWRGLALPQDALQAGGRP